jgi:adenylylsulfate kinase
MANKQEQRKRHIAKAITWRVAATTATAVITWLVTGSLKFGLLVGGFESVTKIFLYYFHERVWIRISYGDGRTDRS